MKHVATYSQSSPLKADLRPDPLLAKLQELAALPNGWRFGEGVPPHPTTLDNAREIYRMVASRGLKADAFPGSDGSLILVFYANERCVEISIAQDGRMNVCVEEGEGADFQEIKEIPNALLADAVEEINLLDRH